MNLIPIPGVGYIDPLSLPPRERALVFGISGGAGNYPDVPGPRMAYDRDGTVVLHTFGGATQDELSAAEMQAINDESDATNYAGMQSLGASDALLIHIFPELRDLNGYFLVGARGVGSLFDLATSPDTTNGIDGTWTVRAANPTMSALTNPFYRSAIATLSVTGIKGIRFKAGGQPNNGPITVHYYGAIASGQSPDRLRLWQPVTDAEVGGAYFDWGNVPRLSSADKTFRVKNNSATLTAQDPVVGVEALTDTTPSVPGQFLLSLDGVNFTSSVTLPDLAPGAISAVITVRRTTPLAATLGVWTARITAVAASWT